MQLTNLQNYEVTGCVVKAAQTLFLLAAVKNNL